MTIAPAITTWSNAANGPVLQVFDHVPLGYLAYAVADDSCEPLIQCGEIAIIDPTDHEPENGALFLRKVGSAQHGRVSYRIEETILQDRNLVVDGQVERQPAWLLGSHHRPHGRVEIEAWLRAGRPGIFVDGPYSHYGDKAWFVRDQLVGRVVGILTGATAQKAPAGLRDSQMHSDPLLRPSYSASAPSPSRNPAPIASGSEFGATQEGY